MPFRLLFRRKAQGPVASVGAAALAPLAQAARCLDLWLREEGRHLSPRQHQRAAALIARYFAHEEDANDQLILSFLRHYSGFSAVDLDDPQAVRLELKAALDRAVVKPAARDWRPWLSAITGVIATIAILGTVYLSQQTLTVLEQENLRKAVAQKASETAVPAAAVWSEVKRATGVRRYADIRRWDRAKAEEAIKNFNNQ